MLPAGVPGFVASRASGDHVLVSTDTGILAEAAEIGIDWMDLVLYGNETARRAVAERPCGACAADLWTVAAKHLDDPSGGVGLRSVGPRRRPAARGPRRARVGV